MLSKQLSPVLRTGALRRRATTSFAVAAAALAVVLLAVLAPEPTAPEGEPSAPRVLEDWRGNSASFTPRSD